MLLLISFADTMHEDISGKGEESREKVQIYDDIFCLRDFSQSIGNLLNT